LLPGIKIDLYGYGPLEESYRTIINELKLENVRLCGPVNSRAELLEVFRRYDLFVCPSVRAADGDMDGIPTSVVEAMAVGLPVLTTALSGIPDLVTDGITGLICESTPESIAATVLRYYSMPVAQVDSIIENARKIAQQKHDVRRLARILLWVWQGKTIDIVIVGWVHRAEHEEVLKRIYTYTSLPFKVIVSANSDRADVLEIFSRFGIEKQNFTLIRNERNLFVGPATNRAIEAGRSDIVIYVCGREGMVLKPGWEMPFVHHMEENPAVGLAGTLCHSPSYLNGASYPSIPLFSKFRNQSFAAQNGNRIFRHVQGGLFAVRRAMYAEIGGFNDDVPHDYTDVEYSFYAESHRWQLGEVEGVVSIFNKSRPTLLPRMDETTAAVHPGELGSLPVIEAIAEQEQCVCNLCGWLGKSFVTEAAGEAVCPKCESTQADRTLFRWLTPSIYLYRRLPALAIGLKGKMKQVWQDQFQGPLMDMRSFVGILGQDGRLSNSDGKFELAVIRAPIGHKKVAEMVFSEVARALSPDGPLLLRLPDKDEEDDLCEILKFRGFKRTSEVRYASSSIRFDWVPLQIWNRQPSG
jgi:hypothetical protein